MALYQILVSSLITRANTYINSVGNRVGSLLWYDYITSVIKELQAGRTLPWARREQVLLTYTDVLIYPLPDDCSALERINVPMSGRDAEGPSLIYSTEKEFKQMIDVDMAIGWENGKKYLLLRRDGVEDFCLEEFDDEATEYTLSGDINNPISDNSDFVSGSAALKFNLYQSVSNNFSISRVLDEVIDVSDNFQLGRIFCDIYMPTIITGGFKLRIGNDTNNYYETPIITSQTHGLDLQAGWNKLSADCADMIQTGTVDLTNIDYIAIVCPATGGIIDNGFKVDGFYLRVGASYRLGYTTNKTITTSGSNSATLSVISDLANLITWDNDFEDLLLYRVLDKAGFFSYRDIDIVKKAEADSKRLTDSFDLRYPSQEVSHKVVYYKKFKKF